MSKSRKGLRPSIETRAKISKALIGNQHWKANIGSKRTDEQRAKISKAKLGNRNAEGNQNFKGCKHSDEARSKMSEARANRIFPVKNTSIEVAIAKLLKANNFNFVQHKTFKSFGFDVNGLGCPRLLGHQVDFALPEHELIIECDGNYWHNYPHGTVKDFYLDKIVKTNGWKILRFWGSEIKENPEACLNKIILMS